LSSKVGNKLKTWTSYRWWAR